MDDVERAPDEAIAGRVPRTDWYLRPRRWIVVLPAFFAAIVAIFVHSMTELHGGVDARTWAWGAGAALAVVSLSWCSFQVRRIVRAWRGRRAASTAAPWTRDGYWSKEGEVRFVSLSGPVAIERLRTVLAGTSLVTLLAAVVLAVTRRGAAAAGACFAGLVSLVVVAITAWRGFANLRVRWPEFPARTGGPVRLHFSIRKRRAELERLTLTLRCVVETPRGGGMLRPDVRCVFSRSVERGDRIGHDGGAVEVEFDVPADAPGADPNGTPGVYWELAVLCESHRYRYDGVFLVPVYRRPS